MSHFITHEFFSLACRDSYRQKENEAPLVSQVSLAFLGTEVPQVALAMDLRDHQDRKVCRVFQEELEFLVHQVRR